MAMKADLVAKKEVFSLQASSEFPVIGKMPESLRGSVHTAWHSGGVGRATQASGRAPAGSG